MPDQQQQINYGAAPNDGQGDPLRDAFIKTDDNFDAIWAAGPVGSNITILNNTVSVVDTNGNLILKPNGVGVVQANASIVPNSANIRDLGAADRRWRRIFVQTLNTVDFEVDGDLTVSGNLTIQGDTIQIGNLVTDAKTVQLSNTAANAAQASGSGITVGSNDDIATMLYDGTSNVWSMNIGITALGTINAEYFVGNGSLLTGLPASYTNTDVVNLLSSGNVVTDITTSANVSAAYILGNGSQLTGLPEQYGNSNVTTLLANFGSNAIVTTGNIEGGRLEIQNGIGNAWTIYGQRIFAPSGGEWRSEEDSGDDFITSANDGYINLQSLYADGNIASELHLEHGTAHIRIADGPFDDWYFLSGGTMTTPGHIIPQANGMYSLGNATNQWANLWVSNNTIYLGGVPLGITAGNVLTVAGNAVLTNESNTTISTTGNITADYFFGNGSQLTGTIPLANIATYVNIANVQGGSSSSYKIPFTALESGGITQFEIDDIGPGLAYSPANGTVTCGNLRVSGNITAGDNSNISTISANLFVATGNITANYFIGDGSLLTGVASTGNITFTDTTMSPPDGVDITISAANSEVIIEAFDIRLDATDDLRLTGNDIVSLRNRSTTDPITIRTDYDNNDYVWEFAVDGTLTTPGDIVTAGDVTGTAGASTLYFKAQPASNTYIQLNNSVDSVISTVANLEVRTDVSNTAQVWSFDTTGNLTAPGNITANGNVSADRVLTNSLLSETDVFVQALDGLVDIRANGNVVIKSADANYEWLFDDAGVLTTPGDIVVNGGLELSAGIVTTATNSSLQAANGGLLSLSSTDSNTTSESAVRAYVDTADNANNRVYIYTDNQGTGDLGTWTFAPDGTLTLPGDTAFMDASANFVGIYPDASQNNGIELYTTATEIFNDGNVNISANVAGTGKTWTFDNTGDFTAPGAISATGNITAGNILTDGYYYANGAPFTPGSNYGDSNVVSLLSSFGSNTVSTTGNITAANFIGNVSLTGNITGTSANVEIAANAYVWTFDNTGILTLPAVGGDEGGEINFGIPAANTTLLNTVKIDVYQDRIRFFDGSTKGVYIDLSQADAGVGTALGYLNIPQVTLSANTTAALADSGKHFYSTTSGNLAILIPTNANVAFPTGTAFTVVVQAAGNVLVNADTGVTLYMAGSSSAGNRTVGAYGMATVMKVASDTWFINGSGVY